MSVISVQHLTMTFQAPVRAPGLRAAVGSLFRRQYRAISAVRDLSFDLPAGEVVGFLGPNGAGKTTTLKILSGILHPTSGAVQVLGHVPWRREVAFLRRIALIRGSQPIGGPPEVTVLDALRFQQLIYEVTDADFRRNLGELTELLALERVLPRQIRALSLGERMRAGLALALLYRPQVLFLDEPTIGLDVSAVASVRQFIAAYSRETGATVVLTSHYMADVEALCARVVLINDGALAYIGNLVGLAQRLAPYKLLRVAVVDTVAPPWSMYGEVVAQEAGAVSLRVRRDDAPAMTARLLAELPVADLSVTDPPLEAVIDQVYREGVT